MTDAPDTHERRFPTLAVVLCVVVLLPVAYVLSSGPAIWLVTQGVIDFPLFEWCYYPVRILSENSELFSITLKWYLSCWGVE
jgi:hypothetical protein